MSCYYVLKGHEVKQCSDVLEWANFFERTSREVKREHIDGATISTVFVGLNMGICDTNPLLFETAIFGGEHDGYVRRYSTWDEAEKGHRDIIDTIDNKEEHIEDRFSILDL